jgi:hypothetical protein
MKSELREIARTLASLTDEEYRQVTTEVRGVLEDLEDRQQKAVDALHAYRKGQ